MVKLLELMAAMLLLIIVFNITPSIPNRVLSISTSAVAFVVFVIVAVRIVLKKNHPSS